MSTPTDKSERVVRGGGCFNHRPDRLVAYTRRAFYSWHQGHPMTPKQIVRGGSWQVRATSMTQANLRCHTLPTATDTQGFRTFRPSRIPRVQ